MQLQTLENKIVTKEDIQTLFNKFIYEFDFDNVRNKKTKADYAKALSAYLIWLNDGNFNWQTVQAYMDYLADSGYSDSTMVQRRSAVLKAVEKLKNMALSVVAETMQDAHLRTEVVNFCAMFSQIELDLQKGEINRDWLTKDQLKQLLGTPNGKTALRDKAIIALMAGAGLRRGEISKLTKANIRRVDGRLFLWNMVGKFNKVRTIPVNKWVEPYLIDYMETVDGDKLFDIADVTVSQRVKRWVKDINSDASAHTLRRTYGRLMYKEGVDIYKLSLLLGHEDTRTTAIYIGSDLELVDVKGFEI